jgi:hypothetical protein
LPEALENKMGFSLGLDASGEPVELVTFPWAALNNHKVILSFKAATPADQQTLDSFISPASLPGSIPAYLVAVVPELSVDEQVVARGNAMRLGEDLQLFFNLDRVGGIGSQVYTYPVPAGSYESVMVGGGSVSNIAIAKLKEKISQTNEVVQGRSSNRISGTDLLGDMFYLSTLGYFGEYLTFSRMTSMSANAQHGLSLGYGTLGYEPGVQKFFGFARAIETGAVAVNVKLGWTVGALDGDATKQVGLSLQTGSLSSILESAVIEQVLSSSAGRVEAASAVKLIQIAAGQGQKIYRINRNNMAEVLPNLHLDSVAMSEIGSALAAGKEVVTHTDRITVSGWTGDGYIIFDPVSGDGAYKISGGTNGSAAKLEHKVFFVLSFIGETGHTLGEIFELGKVFGEIFEALGQQAQLFGFLAGIFKIIGECEGAALQFMIMLETLMTMIAIMVALIATMFLGPLSVLILATVAELIGRMVVHHEEEVFCEGH